MRLELFPNRDVKMEILFYGFVFLIVVMFIASFVQTLLHPPVEITSSELPAIVLRELDLISDLESLDHHRLNSRHCS